MGGPWGQVIYKREWFDDFYRLGSNDSSIWFIYCGQGSQYSVVTLCQVRPSGQVFTAEEYGQEQVKVEMWIVVSKDPLI